MTLHEYLSKELFEPLALRDTVFAPEMGAGEAERLVPAYMREEDGGVAVFPRVQAPKGERVTDVESRVHGKYTGAGNVVGSAVDYAEVLVTLLNEGVSVRTGRRVLGKESVKLMFSPALPEQVGRVDAWIEGAGPDMPLATVAGGGDWSGGDGEVSWGLAGALQGIDRAGGRRRGTGYWMGIFGTEWWVDFETGVGVVVFGNCLPFLDPVWKGFVGEVERVVYAGLK